MNLIDTVKLALRLHAGQVDAGGMPYVMHPFRVFARVVDRGGNEVQQRAALLHDVIEDCGVSRDLLVSLGVEPAVADMVEVLSHNKREPYSSYLQRVIAHPGASLVKWADVMDNSDPIRLEQVAKVDAMRAARLALKYERALQILPAY